MATRGVAVAERASIFERWQDTSGVVHTASRAPFTVVATQCEDVEGVCRFESWDLTPTKHVVTCFRCLCLLL